MLTKRGRTLEVKPDEVKVPEDPLAEGARERHQGMVLFVHQSRMAAPPAAVFAFHERPDALARLLPPWEKVEIVQPPATLLPGTRVVLGMRMGPFRFTWEAEHTLYEKNVLFQDRMVRGPFRTWVHTHRVLPAGDGGTVLRDEVEFELPPYALPGLPFVKRRLRRMFRYRHHVTDAETAFTSQRRGA